MKKKNVQPGLNRCLKNTKRCCGQDLKREGERLVVCFTCLIKKVTRGFCNNFYSKFSLSKKRLKNNFIYYTRKIGNVFSPDHPRNINLKDSVDIFLRCFCLLVTK